MKNIERVTLLYDFFGSLLTTRQQELIQAYFLEDLSLAEIASEHQVSRQAVHDQIRRAETALESMEAATGLVAEYKRQQAQLLRVAALLDRAQSEANPCPEIAAAARLVGELLTGNGAAAELANQGSQPETAGPSEHDPG